jgi:threonine synthase
MVPKTAPAAKLLQIMMYGAELVLVDGNYDAAFDFSVKASKHFGWFNRNTAFNPFTIEGKKTVSYEIYHQSKGILPSHIFVSVGDGVIISGVYKGFEDLLELGIIDKIPTIVAVQSEKSDNLVRNMNRDDFEMTPATTLADSISVDYPRNFYMAKSYLKKYDGKWLTVSDEDIIKAASVLAKNTGIFAEPAAAAAMAGMQKYKRINEGKNLESMLVLSTGSGLKDLNACRNAVKMPDPIAPTLEELEKVIGGR